MSNSRMAPLQFSRLVRFNSRGGPVYGEAILPQGQTDCSVVEQAKLIELDEPDNPFAGGRVTDKVVTVPRNSILEPITRSTVGTVRCLGLNYANHAKETNMTIPKDPVLFYKPRTAICGTGTPITVSKMFQEDDTLDYEVELVVVIGKEGRNISVSSALEYVFGYTAGNDVSHREWQIQKGSGQWNIGKGCDNWAPIGPAIVGRDVIPDPQKLRVMTKVNGKVMQDSNTADMIFGVAHTISFLSQGTTLMPGDLIFTGTPEGVGMSRKPQLFLKHGDEVEVYIDKIGSIKNKVEHEKGSPKAKL